MLVFEWEELGLESFRNDTSFSLYIERETGLKREYMLLDKYEKKIKKLELLKLLRVVERIF